MTKEDKVKFILKVLEKESYKYMHYPVEYSPQDEIWLDRYIAKTHFEVRYLSNEDELELAYEAALRLSKRK